MRIRPIVVFFITLAVSELAHAGTISLNVGPGGVSDSYILGEAIPGLQDGGLLNRDEAMIEAILAMSAGARTPCCGEPEYYRSSHVFGTLPDPDQIGAVSASGITSMTSTLDKISIALPADTAFQYLVGAWNGPNGGVEVWYIGAIAAGTTIEIPRYARPSPGPSGRGATSGSTWPQDLVDGYSARGGSKYQITSYSLFNPTVSVPDGGTTAVLVGLAVLGLGFARRFIG